MTFVTCLIVAAIIARAVYLVALWRMYGRSDALIRLHGMLPWVWAWRRVKAYRFGRKCGWSRIDSLKWMLS